MGVNPSIAAKDAQTIKDPEFFLGYTLTPSESPSGNVRVLITDRTGKASNTPEVEAVVTTGHELYGHALPQIQGKPYQHDDRGPVDTQHKQIEARSRANFLGQQQVKPRGRKTK
jgi:hypothetical protein